MNVSVWFERINCENIIVGYSSHMVFGNMYFPFNEGYVTEDITLELCFIKGFRKTKIKSKVLNWVDKLRLTHFFISFNCGKYGITLCNLETVSVWLYYKLKRHLHMSVNTLCLIVQIRHKHHCYWNPIFSEAWSTQQTFSTYENWMYDIHT